jgi:hypothetical protein
MEVAFTPVRQHHLALEEFELPHTAETAPEPPGTTGIGPQGHAMHADRGCEFERFDR